MFIYSNGLQEFALVKDSDLPACGCWAGLSFGVVLFYYSVPKISGLMAVMLFKLCIFAMHYELWVMPA